MDVGSVTHDIVEYQRTGALNDGSNHLQDGQVPKRSRCGDQGFFQRGFFLEECPRNNEGYHAGKILDYITPKVGFLASKEKNQAVQNVHLIDDAGARSGGAPWLIPVDPHEKEKRP